MEQKSPQSSFSWIQFYSSFGLKAARIACSAIQERINFSIISTHILCAHEDGLILQSLLCLLRASPSCGSFAVPTSKINFNVGQHVIP